MIVVILAGGEGTRLWPLSSKGLPKQFLKIIDHRSLLQKTYLRFSLSKAVEKILIVSSEKYRPIIEKHLSEINASCPVITEPCRRNTAPAICLAVKYIQEKMNVSPTSKILIAPSDHLITPEDKFREDLTLLENVSFDDDIITFGVKPTRAEVGYGYLKIKKDCGAILSSVDSFIEKPSIKKAQEFLLSDKYFWNAGIFLFTIKSFWNELKNHAYELYEKFQNDYLEILKTFKNLPNVSIDYALMEKTKNIKVFPLNVSWSDIGSWDSIYDVLEKDENLNVKCGKVCDIDTKNSLIIASKKEISVVGVDNLIIVETDDGIFIGKKGQSQKIKFLIK